MIRRPLDVLVAFSACAVLGCAGEAREVMSAPPESADAGVANDVAGLLPADFTGPGVYTVPAAPAVTFDVPGVHLRLVGGALRLYYDLPVGLVGNLVPVTMAGPQTGSSSFDLVGDVGTAHCTVTASELVCREQLAHVHVEPTHVLAALSSDDPRRQAIQAFAVDPIGVLQVELATVRRPSSSSASRADLVVPGGQRGL